MKKAIKCLIFVLVGALLALLIACGRGLLNETDPVAIYHNLSDCFMVVGTVATGFGLLLFVSNHGAFNGITYGLKSFIGIFRKKRMQESYYDYTVRRSENKLRFGIILISGLILLSLAIAFYLLYRNSL